MMNAAEMIDVGFREMGSAAYELMKVALQPGQSMRNRGRAAALGAAMAGLSLTGRLCFKAMRHVTASMVSDRMAAGMSWTDAPAPQA